MPRPKQGNIDYIFENNKKWVSNTLAEDPEYFSRWAASQKPQHLWIGCSDSRVVAEAATGLKVGDVFVHRNVGNVLSHSDNNAMSALEFSVKVLGVKHVMVCGHTNCGAVKAALTLPSSSALLTNCWISQIRDIRNQHVDELVKLPFEEQAAHLVKLNVMKQVFNVCTSPVLQQMWEGGKEVYVHGLVYDVSSGGLERLVGPLGGNDDVPEDLGASTNLDEPAAQLQGHTLEETLRRLADALGKKDDADARVLLQNLSLKSAGSGAAANGSGEAGDAAAKSAGSRDSEALQTLRSLVQGGSTTDQNMDARVLSKMQDHIAFETAAKQAAS